MSWHGLSCLGFNMRVELISKLNDCAAELQKIKKRIDKDKFDEMVMFLQRYAIIKACGTIEHVIKNMIADHVDANTNPEIQNYIATNVRENSRNPSTGKISGLLSEFSPGTWGPAFEAKLKIHVQEKGALNSLVQLRNDFAHGSNPNTTIDTIIRYFNDSCTIITLAEEALNGT